MKKLIALLLVLTLPLSFIACSNDETSSGEDTSNQEQTASTEADESNTNDTTKAPDNFEETLDFNKETTIEETVIYNKDGLKVTAKSLKHCSEIDGHMLFWYSALEKISKQHGYMLFSIEVENTSGEEIVCNFTEKISINGFEISTTDPDPMSSFAHFGNIHAFIFDSQGKDCSRDSIYLSPGEWNRIDYYLDCVTLMSLRIFEIAEIKPTGAKMGGYRNQERNGIIDCQKVKTSAFQSHNNSATHSEALMAEAFEAKGRELVYFSDFSSGMYYNYAEDKGYGSVTVLSAALIEGGTGDADHPDDHAIIWIENSGDVDLYINNGFASNMGLPLCVGEKGILFAPISFSPQQSDPVYINCSKSPDPYNEASGSYETPLLSFDLLINLSDTENGSNAKGIEVYKNGSESAICAMLSFDSSNNFAACSIRCCFICAAIDIPYTSLNAFFSVVGFIRNRFDKSSMVTLSPRCFSKYS